MKLPKGYYAVTANEETLGSGKFLYKGIEYEVTCGVNLFPNLNDAYVAAKEIPDTVISGLDYTEFDTPVVLLGSGRHLYNKGTPGSRSVAVDHSVTVLGEGASVNPNLPTGDISTPPALNPKRAENESVLVGSFWWGRFIISREEGVDRIIFDGITLSAMCLEDMRSEGPTDAYISFRNIIHESPMFRTLYKIIPPKEGSSLHRRVELINLRIHNMDDADYGNYLITPAVDELLLDGAVIDTTTQILGFTSLSGSLSNMPKNASEASFAIKNSYFTRLMGENSIRISLQDIGERRFSLDISDTVFYNAPREGEAALTLDGTTYGVTVRLQNVSFTDTRENSSPAIKLLGKSARTEASLAKADGFSALFELACPTPCEIPENIEVREEDFVTDLSDPHTVLGKDSADFSRLDSLYEGRRAYYGDLHVHTACGGTSDGRYPMADWPCEMDRLGLDFAAVVDHKQMRGFFLPEWSEERFIIGTEPGTNILDLNTPRHGLLEMHYNMLFPHKYGLAMVLANFPEFNFRGDELTGSYQYPNFTKARFSELVEYIRSIGGTVVHPHPKMMICSADPLDYYIGEFTFLETLYDGYGSNWSARNYKLWCDLLALGKHVYASGGSDTHGPVRADTVTVFYSKARHSSELFEIMKRGDFSVGAVGIKMAIGDSPVGSVTKYNEGDVLCIRTGDFHPTEFKENTEYELRVITDKGVAYASRYDGKAPQALAIRVKDRAFYRVEIYDLTHHYVVSHSNPIWLR